MNKYILIIIVILLILLGLDSPEPQKQYSDQLNQPSSQEDQVASTINTVNTRTNPTETSYEVVRVIDGDTIDVLIEGEIERVRLIGINTPETVDPRKPVECFSKEASSKAKEVLNNQRIILESDPSQGERDKYNRLLRYVFLLDSSNFNLLMIKSGYAYEYTYNLPYKYQEEFKQAQKYAEKNGLGLWGADCVDTRSSTIPTTPKVNESLNSCNIKGNINSKKEKIYHLPGCGSYEKTVINEEVDEKWFCSEEEALDAGWRKALNC